MDWQPISCAPKDGSRVLLWAKEWSNACTGQYYGERRGWGVFYDVGMFKYQPTDWMQLPKPPLPHNKDSQE